MITIKGKTMRKLINLNVGWRFLKSCSSIKEWNESLSDPVDIPHTWNNFDGQDGNNDYFRGACCYKKEFSRPSLLANQQVWLQFDGINSSASVFLNSSFVAHHDGGYSSFCFQITNYLQEENQLFVIADNSPNDRVYPQTADFTFYGGIYRDVRLIIVDKSHFAFTENGGKGLKVNASDDGRLVVDSQIQGDYDSIEYSLYDGNECKMKGSGVYCEMRIENVHLWDGLKDPHLYRLEAKLIQNNATKDLVEQTVGFRSFSIDSEKGFFLNGKSYPLRGVSRHQDRLDVGNAISKQMHEEDMALILECGANSVRLAHYQHDQYFYDLCDQYGVLCWAEIPYITKHMDNGFENTVSQLSELIEQNYNHPSIFCWGISNEITAAGNSEAVFQNNLALLKLSHDKDASRPVAMAHAFMLGLEEKIVTLPDIIGYNLYYGWYLGEVAGNCSFLDRCHASHPEKPLALTEFGCDANLCFQASTPVKGDYSEQYQSDFHEFMCQEIDKRPYLWGTFIWNMFDFGADARDEGGVKGRNNKGLVSFDRKICKDSFYAVKAWYSTKPFVHICGERYVNRVEDESEIKVYSNQEEVELFNNGKSLGLKRGKHVFVFEVKLEENNKIEATSGELRSSIMVKKVAEPDPSYFLIRQDKVANWFDGLDIKERSGFYSVFNTIGEIMESEEGRILIKKVQQMRAKDKNSIASSVKMSNQMIAMTLKDVKLTDLLCRSNIDKNTVAELNRKLNNIAKKQLKTT